jgi:hypothetical protein
MSGALPRVIGRPFRPGEGGRPRGVRNKLGDAFVKVMLEDFEVHGTIVVQRVREEDPSTYLKVVAGLLPKQITGEDGGPIVERIERIVIDLTDRDRPSLPLTIAAEPV